MTLTEEHYENKRVHLRKSPLRIFIGSTDDDPGNTTSMSFWSYVTYLVTQTSLSSFQRYVYRIAKIATTATNPRGARAIRPTGLDNV